MDENNPDFHGMGSFERAKILCVVVTVGRSSQVLISPRSESAENRVNANFCRRYRRIIGDTTNNLAGAILTILETEL